MKMKIDENSRRKASPAVVLPPIEQIPSANDSHLEDEARLAEHMQAIGSAYDKHSSTCSSICRQATFALFAVWAALSYSKEQFTFDLLSFLSIFTLVLCLASDVFQYFFTVLQCRKINREVNDSSEECAASICARAERQRMRMNQVTYRYFIAKIIFLAIAFVLTIVAIVTRWLSFGTPDLQQLIPLVP